MKWVWTQITEDTCVWWREEKGERREGGLYNPPCTREMMESLVL